MPASLTLLFFASLSLELVRADYTIDDSNYSILSFSENPAGPVWGPFGSDTGEVLEIGLPNGTMQTVDATQCYDGTYTYAACGTSDNCAVQFSFTGSGITIYVLQAGPQGMTASLSVDSGTATTETLGAPPPPQYYIPRVPLFDIQDIESGTHTAVMTVLDWNGSFSGMMLDYIDINQTTASLTGTSPNTPPSPSPSPSTSSSPSPTASTSSVQSPTLAPPSSSTDPQTGSQQTSSTVSQTNTGVAIVSVLSLQTSGGETSLPSSTGTNSGNGTAPTSTSLIESKTSSVSAAVGGGIGGGVGLLALIALILFCCRRRRRLRREQMLNERPRPMLSPETEVTSFNRDHLSDPFGSSAAVSVIPPVAFQEQSNTSPIINTSHTRVSSSGNISTTSSVPVSLDAMATAVSQDPSTVRLETRTLPASYRNEKARPETGTMNRGMTGAHLSNALTDEQADFVNSLFNNNVPAPVVARVLERMLANPRGTGSIVNDPDLRSHLYPTVVVSQTEGAPWPSGMSDAGDAETTTGTAPPSYDYVRAQ